MSTPIRMRRSARLAPSATLPLDGSDMALVTVLHDSRRELGWLLASVARHLPAAHVVVVDSGSGDAGAALARGWSGHSTVIELGDNVGFGRASNAGIEAVERPVTA